MVEGQKGRQEGEQDGCNLRDAGSQEGVLDIAWAAHEDHHKDHNLLQLQPLQRFRVGLPHIQHQLTQIVHKVFLHSWAHASIRFAMFRKSTKCVCTIDNIRAVSGLGLLLPDR